MNMNPLPPQAYTKETLAKAFAWLQGQPDNIKDIAHNSDVLVSLYLKTKMNGDDALERPSIKNFKNELRSLASQMGEFEILQDSGSSAQTYSPKTPPTQTVVAPTSLEKLGGSLLSHFDPRTIETLKEIMRECNLSSENEALRLLVAVGYKTLKKI